MNTWKFIFKIVIVIIIILIIYLSWIFYLMCTTQVRDTKDFSQIYVEDYFDYTFMINPPKKYDALEQIDKEMRIQVSEYMKENNLKLKEGKQEFVRNNPTFKELVEDGFLFEKIEE